MIRLYRFIGMITAGLLVGAVSAPSGAQVMQLYNKNYVVSYNPKTGIPERVEWFILPQYLGKAPRKLAGGFRQDTRVQKPRPKPSQYTNTGYHRGHMCPSADFTASVKLMRNTFLMSNICPMAPWVNMGPWKATEDKCRTYARKYGGVRVVAYSFILSPDTTYLPRSDIAIPSSFGKQCYTINKDSLLEEWHVPNF